MTKYERSPSTIKIGLSGLFFCTYYLEGNEPEGCDNSGSRGHERSEALYVELYEEAQWSKINNGVKRSYS